MSQERIKKALQAVCYLIGVTLLGFLSGIWVLQPFLGADYNFGSRPAMIVILALLFLLLAAVVRKLPAKLALSLASCVTALFFGLGAYSLLSRVTMRRKGVTRVSAWPRACNLKRTRRRRETI